LAIWAELLLVYDRAGVVAALAKGLEVIGTRGVLNLAA
jgi:predicted nucleic acid-binding protein